MDGFLASSNALGEGESALLSVVACLRLLRERLVAMVVIFDAA